jgi:alcohol dehydrogenase class IV
MGQTIRTGAGCFEGLAALAAESGCRRLLVAHGRGSYAASGAAAAVEAVSGCEVMHFDGVATNPEVANVSRCAVVLAEWKPDAVLAVGGGSAMDTVKAAFPLAAGFSLDDVLANKFTLAAGRPRFWAAPTTAGSGSESTHFAVLYRDGVKYSIAEPALKPDLVFLDPLLTRSCSPSLALASGLDAVCQAVESYWSKNSTQASRTFSIRALGPLLANIFRAADAPEDLEAGTSMLTGANLAGQAIDMTKTTAAHAMSYGLTSRYGLAHGVAVIVSMRPLVDLMARKYGFFARAGELDQSFSAFGTSFPQAFAAFFGEAWKRLDPAVRAAASSEADLKAAGELAAGVNVERLSNHPVALTSEDIDSLYRIVLGSLGAPGYAKDSK